MCDCRVCKIGRRIESIQDRLPDEREFLDKLYSDLSHAETDAVYWRMKFEGTWPGDHPTPEGTNT